MAKAVPKTSGALDRIDFSQSISNLRMRSQKSRLRARLLTLILTSGIYLMAAVVLFLVLRQTSFIVGGWPELAAAVNGMKDAGTLENAKLSLDFSGVSLQQSLLVASATAFVLYLMQICMTFIKYYSQLSELYESQATALEASQGNVEIAYRFAKEFSPLQVAIGKNPTSVHEKIVEAAINFGQRLPNSR